MTITVSNVTNKDSDGVLDVLLKKVDEQLSAQFQNKRITGKEYAEVYLGALTSVLGQSIQFVTAVENLSSQIALNNAQRLQTEAQTLQLTEQTKNIQAQKLQIEAQTIQIQTETANLLKQQLLLDAQVAQATAETANILVTKPQIEAKTAQVLEETTTLQTQRLQIQAQTNYINSQKAQLDSQKLLTDAELLKSASEKTMIDKQVLKLDKDILIAAKQLELLAEQLIKSGVETNLLSAKIKTEEAQYKDTVDGVAVTGIIGKQKDLYGKQSEGFIRDAEQKLLKILSDIWAIQKSTSPNEIDANDTGMHDGNIAVVALKAIQGIGGTPVAPPPPTP